MRYLVSGGSASGKSGYAEHIAAQLPTPRYYIATMRPWDDESRARIEKHRRQRAHLGFETIEHYGDLRAIKLPARGTVLLECMSNLTANVLYGEDAPDEPFLAVCEGLRILEEQCESLIVVTNEVFSDGTAHNAEMRRYLELLGALNAVMGREFDCVTEVVCGIPIAHKGEIL